MRKTDLQIVHVPAVPAFAPELTPEVVAQKEAALSASALIGRVSNASENDSAIGAMRDLKGLSNSLERQRKALTEPFIEAQRTLKRLVDSHRDELDRECGRLECLCKDFALAEHRRIKDEQEAQERELARIEMERQAALQRIEEDRLAAERAAAQAKTDAERKEAEAARLAAELKANQIEAQAEAMAALESRPVVITRAAGQSNRKQWKITQINDFQLLKARPDLVRKIEWDVVAIKQCLADGQKLPGVTAEEDLRVSVTGSGTKVIDV